MRILVTGSTGFIGTALTRLLLQQGHHVRCAMRRSATPPAGAEAVVVGDVAQRPDWRQALQGVNAVVHLAGLAHVAEETQRSGAYRAINVDGTMSLAQAAVAAGVERLIFVSSIAVNGETSRQRPFCEEDAPEPISAYAASKLEAERGLVELAGRHAMAWCIVRPPLVYGANASGNFLRLMRLIARRWPLPLGSATAKRSFIALDNLNSVLLTVLDAPQARNALFLASDGEDVSTAEFVRLLANHMGTTVRLIPMPPKLLKAAAALLGRSEDASKLLDPLQIDSSRLRERLAWKPVVTLDEGLRRAVGRL
jgi:nucleoside-diphosphate-sugar epimerase